MSVEDVIEIYKRVYELPELLYEEQVSSDFFGFYKKKHYFVIISIYNPNKETLLIRDFNKTIGWELPGGFINNNESLEKAVNRISLNEAGLETYSLGHSIYGT
jgi:hypothetical protein